MSGPGPLRRRRIAVLCPYSVFPARYGGALRTYHLCRELSRDFDVGQFAQQVQRAQLRPTLSPRIEEIAPGYVQYASRNPLSIGLFTLTSVLWASPPLWQSRVLSAFAPGWLRRAVERADIIQVEQPWQFAWAAAHAPPQTPVVLDTQNVEADLYPAEALRAPGPIARRLARQLVEQEAAAVRTASLVLAATPEDLAELDRRYGLPRGRSAVVPNGVACDEIKPADGASRERAKALLGLPPGRLVLFLGAVHRPNVEAARAIQEWARTWPDDSVSFVIVGSVGRKLEKGGHPRLRITGPVDDVHPFLAATDVALNPVVHGSGSNLKMLEYMAAGLPIVTTAVGARGLGLEEGLHAVVDDLRAFPSRLATLLGDEDGRRRLGAAARRLAEQRFDWTVIGSHLRDLYAAIGRPAP